ncbi:MAG: M55 family metallopeptidase [Armatimonadetes bacterium]|nr:M55 family metallopeptidase [Armatimonadota bacterium]
MNVYISADIEGITGIASWTQAEGPTTEAYDFAFARRMYTHDVNAAIRGARAAGAKRVVVKDSHGWCKNLLVDELELGTELISGYGAMPAGMMEGIGGDDSFSPENLKTKTPGTTPIPPFDAAILVGYHAMAGKRGLMAHALVGGLHRFWINGKEAGEIAYSAATAGAFGVPLVAVTSDDCGCAEASALNIGIRTYAVKAAMGRFMAWMKHPSETGPGIEKAIRDAVANAKRIAPVRFEGEVSMKISFQNDNLAELASQIPGVSRPEPYVLEWSAPSFLEAAAMAQLVFDTSRAGRVLER